MRAVDLFAGAGGWDIAAEHLGILSTGVENMKEAIATREAAGLRTMGLDVRSLHVTPLHPGTAYGFGLIASPPCQSYSVAGQGKGRAAFEAVARAAKFMAAGDDAWKDVVDKDGKTELVLEPLRLICESRFGYEWICLEQVPTVLCVWEVYADLLAQHGYHVWCGNMTAEQYGVPQTRRRAILIASRDHEVSMPVPSHSKYHSRTPEKLDEGVKKWVSMAEALGWDGLVGFPRRDDGRAGGSIEIDGEKYRARDFRSTEHPSQVVTEKARSWMIRATNDRPNAATRTLDKPAPTMAFGHERPVWISRVADQSGTKVDLSWPEKRPATTVAHRDLLQHPGATANRFNGSTKSRNDGIRVTVEEAGILQSFPADYPWRGAMTKQFLQVGNAIPPLMAQVILSEAVGL